MNYDRFLTRVWDVKQRKMFYSDESKEIVHSTWVVGIEGNYILTTVTADDGWAGSIQIENNAHIPMQCTGLKDKNGKLIWEGDVLKTNNHKWLTNWDDEFGGFWCKRFDNEQELTLNDFGVEIEIIGNIYENPELLEEHKNDE